VTKARDYKGVGQERSLVISFHAHESVGECEGMSPHTPKCAPTLKVAVSMESQIFKEKFQRIKFIELKSLLYHWNYLET
jgi:hypothetical protein